MDTNTSQGFSIELGDGKGITIPEHFRMVKIAEKKIGKGKGKTVAFSLIPAIEQPIPEESLRACESMVRDMCEELQKDILTRMQRDGSNGGNVEELSFSACVAEYANRTFSAETVALWFDSEMADYLDTLISTAKGWEFSEEKPATAEQAKYLETKRTAYRASYVECASKFPSLNPNQCAELLRVLDLVEATGPIVSRIRDKITPKNQAESLGF